MNTVEELKARPNKKIKIIFGLVPLLFIILFVVNGYFIFNFAFGCGFSTGGFVCTHILPFSWYLTLFAIVVFIARTISASFIRFREETAGLRKVVTYLNISLFASIVLSLLSLVGGPSIPRGYQLALFYGEGPSYCKNLSGEEKIECYLKLKVGGYPITCDDIPDSNVQNICKGNDLAYLEKCFELDFIEPVLDVSDSKSVYWWDHRSRDHVMGCFQQRTNWASSDQKKVSINNFAQTTTDMCGKTEGYLQEYCFFNLGINYDNGASCQRVKSEKFRNLCLSLVFQKVEKLAKNNVNKFGWIVPGDAVTDKVLDKDREYLFNNGLYGSVYTPLILDERTKYVECRDGYFTTVYIAGKMLDNGDILVSEVRCVD
ncbi:MAG: hypothetical protein RL150_460 [Candidatus Parcubacteria bacterium]|jgi:membrane protein implicated in regulation of membrane protease activity